MTVRVGQVWEDTRITNPHTRWLVRVVKLNRKSVRVEPCGDDGFKPALPGWQYRMEFPHFERDRMRLIEDADGELG